MEDINPVLYIVSWLRYDLEVGRGVAASISRLKQKHPDCIQVQMLVGVLPARGQMVFVRKLVDRGLGGQPILSRLIEIEGEIHRTSVTELEAQLARLPVKCLVPIMFFMFPAFLLLLVGPWIMQIIG